MYIYYKIQRETLKKINTAKIYNISIQYYFHVYSWLKLIYIAFWIHESPNTFWI